MKKFKFITTKIAADRLGYSQDYIRKLCAEGKIVAQRLAHDWIFSEAAIKHLHQKPVSKPKMVVKEKPDATRIFTEIIKEK